MIIKYSLIIIVAISFSGCPKNYDEAAAPVKNFFNAMNAEDSAGMVNAMSFDVRREFLSNWNRVDSGYKAAGLFFLTKGSYEEIKVLKVESDTPDTAKVYVIQNLTGKLQEGPDSLYYIVVKEGNSWKLGSLKPVFIRDPFPNVK